MTRCHFLLPNFFLISDLILPYFPLCLIGIGMFMYIYVWKTDVWMSRLADRWRSRWFKINFNLPDTSHYYAAHCQGETQDPGGSYQHPRAFHGVFTTVPGDAGLHLNDQLDRAFGYLNLTHQCQLFSSSAKTTWGISSQASCDRRLRMSWATSGLFRAWSWDSET